ncbi:MAG: S8 family serine peptidase [Thermoplasmatota archaeon]
MSREDKIGTFITMAAVLLLILMSTRTSAADGPVSSCPVYSFDLDGDHMDDRISSDTVFPLWALINVDSSENMGQVRSDLKLLDCEPGASLSSIPVIIACFSNLRSLESAAAIPHVEVIEMDREVRFTIDTSAKAMKVEPSDIYQDENVRHLGFDGEGMTIAVLDLGIDNDHEVLQGSFVAGVDFTLPDTPLTPRDGSYDPDDKGGHGTGVACVLASRGNSTGYGRGIAPAAGIIDLKMSDYNPAYIRAMAEAMDWCLVNKDMDWGNGHTGIDVISMSALTGLDPDGSIAQLLQLIAESGIPFVQAAGNDGVQHGEDPATYFWSDFVITAGGLDDRRTIDRSDDVYWSGATYGPRASDGDDNPYDELRPDVVATAVNLTVAAHSSSSDTASGWRVVEGTSYATPHVSGVVALMLQANPDIAALGGVRVLETVRNILHESAEARGDPYDPKLSDKYNVRYGFGILDGYRAVKMSIEFKDSNRAPTIIELSAVPDTLEPSGNSTITVDAFDPDGDPLGYGIGASGGEISGSGPVWTWTAPEMEGEYRIDVMVSDPSGLYDSGSVTVSVRESPQSNSPPTIISFTASEEEVEVEGLVDLKVVASDPDGDPLEFDYSVSSGKIIGSGDEVKFRASEVPGEVVIMVTANDGRGGTDGEQLIIDVRSPPPIQPPVIVSVIISPASVDAGDTDSKVTVTAYVQEITYGIEYVYADLSEIGKGQRSYMEYEGSHYDDGILLQEYSLDVSRPLALVPGNYSIHVTAEDSRHYRSDTVEEVLIVMPPEGLDVDIEDAAEESGFPLWVLVPIIIVVAALLAVLFFFIRISGSGKRSKKESSRSVYVVSEIV